jgi:hypothetical protein
VLADRGHRARTPERPTTSVADVASSNRSRSAMAARSPRGRSALMRRACHTLVRSRGSSSSRPHSAAGRISTGSITGSEAAGRARRDLTAPTGEISTGSITGSEAAGRARRDLTAPRGRSRQARSPEAARSPGAGPGVELVETSQRRRGDLDRLDHRERLDRRNEVSRRGRERAGRDAATRAPGGRARRPPEARHGRRRRRRSRCSREGRRPRCRPRRDTPSSSRGTLG